ncbi:glucose-1-phosphate thymidylyltransferase [Candidatus Acetothermia bacterium]|nr:glucose-1-phosphate thymidylyltransferase [Candidatus Acetothermia bacterium]
MKAIILCAGEGTRLRPLTYTGAKHLIPVANRPIITYSIEMIKEAGITDLGIIVSPHRREEFRQALSDGSELGVKIEYIPQEKPQGLAHAIACAQDFVKQDPFIVCLGDNLLENGIANLVQEFSQSKANGMILLTEVEDPRAFGVARLEKGVIKQVIEKPKDPPSNLAIIGIYLFDKHIFEAIKEIKPSWRGELEVTDAIQKLIDKGYRVLPHVVQKGWWKDVGKPEDILHANRLILERIESEKILGKIDAQTQIKGRVIVSEGAEIIHSELRGPLVIGPGCVIENSFIGPFTAIGPNVSIKESEIEYSIVMEGSSIVGAGRIDHSLIGRNVQIGKKDRLPEAYNMILGDNSQIKLI